MPAKFFRKFKITEDDVSRVIKHLKLHSKITANDVVTRPLPKPRRKGKVIIYNEPIPWVKPNLLKASFQDKQLKAGKNGKQLLFGLEDDVWKRIVPREEITEFMRHELLSSDSRMPLSRDAAHYHLMKSSIGISRRAAYAFLEKQGVLQVTKNIPNERVKGGQPILTRGHVEIDLIEGQGRDITKETGKISGDWYWLSLVDRLTGYGVVELVQDSKGKSTKAAKWVALALKDALDRLEHALGKKVKVLSSDAGREFFAETKKMLVKRGIKQKTVARGSKVEQYNQTFQRNFYRLLRLKRGSFNEIEQQAEEITNNTKSKFTKLSPKDAVKRSDQELALKYNSGREKQKPYKGKEPMVGDLCRVLLKQRKNMKPNLTINGQSRMYKTYHGRHFAKGTHKIRKRMLTNKKAMQADETVLPIYRFYVNGRWVDKDEVMLISGVDDVTAKSLKSRT